MFLTVASLLLAPLFVFGVYHLLTWFNILRVNERVYWKRVAIASAISHFVLLTGYLIFSYFDFQGRLQIEATSISFGEFLFSRSGFWRVMTIFDSVPTLVLLTMFFIMDRAGLNPPGLLVGTFAIAYVVGTLQWFWIGGGIGALLERFWSGLKTGDDEDEEWF
jgi:hypothetical protein